MAVFAIGLPLLASHVPTYGCVDNCCKPPHTLPLSQVTYHTGTGGLEIHTGDLPIERTVLNYDVTFRDRVDPSTYILRIGCSSTTVKDVGCYKGERHRITAPRFYVTDYKKGVVEPFTQTHYRSAMPDDYGGPTRVANYSDLVDGSCLGGHFVIYLEQLPNATKDIVWGAVVGCEGGGFGECEWFTARELIEFPVYILRNHGDRWNKLGWTWLFTLATSACIVFALVGCICIACDVSTHPSFTAVLDNPPTFGWTWIGLGIMTHTITCGSGTCTSQDVFLSWLATLPASAIVVIFLKGGKTILEAFREEFQ